MSLPFLILAGTVAYTVIFPDGIDGGSDIPSSTQTSKIPKASPKAITTTTTTNNGVGGRPVSIFLSGVVVGVGLSLWASYELKRTRLWQRARLQLLSWLYDDFSSVSMAWTDGGGNGADCISGSDASRPSSSSNDNNDNRVDPEDTRLVDKYRRPTKLDAITGIPLNVDGGVPSSSSSSSHCGSHVDLVSPDWTLTNGMSVDLLTIAAGSEIVPNKSKGVEFYYVVRGDGDLIRDHNQTVRIMLGMGFIVDPDSVRGFKARGNKLGKLVLLRAMDVTIADTGTGPSESITTQQGNSSSNKLSNAKNMIVAGLGKIQSMVEAYGSERYHTIPSSSLNNLTVNNNNNDTFDQ
jgi:mannose-6-phosphate isomerase-like protein (cupin superfamily)